MCLQNPKKHLMIQQIQHTFPKVTGSLETKYKIKEHGVGITEKWTTDNR